MINQDSQLKLQAYLDGELPSREATEIKKWIADDREAKALLEEMTSLRGALTGYEAGCKLPESREFYWSKIQREIERQEQTAPARSTSESWFTWLRQHFLPVSTVAMVACFCGVLALHSGKGGSQYGEMELASDDMGSYTFRDPEQKLTMVWLYDRNSDSPVSDSSSVASVETE